MRKILFLLVLTLNLFAYGQEIQFEDVVKIDSTVSKEELYNRARSWLAKTYKSEKDVMSIEDRSSGEISGNGAIKYNPQSLFFGVDCARGFISYKINIYVKEGRYKYKLHSFVHEGTRCPGGSIISYGLLTNSEKPSRGAKIGWNETKQLAKADAIKTIESLKQSMNTQYESSNDW